jgi:NAD-dependent SIR2 family protein deacetylase
MSDIVKKIGDVINDADAILIMTGAGMGVGSGFGTFRGQNAGVWEPLETLGIDFTEISSPIWFQKDISTTCSDSVNFAYSFWQFRYQSYRYNEPHKGYHYIRKLVDDKLFGGFSFTSNIDNHWNRCGFDSQRVLEVHGCIANMQCSKKYCNRSIWPTKDEEYNMKIDTNTHCVLSEVPKCIHCQAIARPNVYMFDDFEWETGIYDTQKEQYDKWISTIIKSKCNVVVLEIGAGNAIPTVRHESEQMTKRLQSSGCKTTLVRINPDYPDIPSYIGNHHISSDTTDSMNLIEEIYVYIKGK